MFSKAFIRFNWATLICIYLVVIAGSFVRITGSGMGCPDWPKCFGSWIPPSDVRELPADYKTIYGEQRVKKVEKFARLLSAIGMRETAEKIKKDPATYEELPFNAQKTWTEYVNRLAGFLAGNGVLIVFIWAIWSYRKNRKLVRLAFLNLILIGFQGWFGSMVVASNLVPWTITVHLFFALLIIAIQLVIIQLIRKPEQQFIPLSKQLRLLIALIFAITAYQLFLGTQVREYIDELTKQGLGRESWSSKFGWSFFIHRSFSWAVLVLMTILVYLNWKGNGIRSLYVLYGVLAIELVSGVLLAYAEMPGLVQVSHLLFASILFGMLFLFLLQSRSKIPDQR